MSWHFRNECKHGAVISQCRCPGPRIANVIDPCPFPEHVSTSSPTPDWLGTTLESCVRDVAIGRIAAHSNVTAAMVDEWRAYHRAGLL